MYLLSNRPSAPSKNIAIIAITANKARDTLRARCDGKCFVGMGLVPILNHIGRPVGQILRSVPRGGYALRRLARTERRE